MRVDSPVPARTEALREAQQLKGFLLWIAEWSARWGRLEDVTAILPIPFTYHTAPACAYPCRHLQLYSVVEVEALRGGGLLTWPVDVYGVVAVRDTADRCLNIVFYRSRENCQTLNGTDRFLELVGPTRAVVVSESLPYPVTVEVELKVRGGAVESEDRCLSFVAAPLSVDLDHQNHHPSSSERRRRSYTSKCSTLTFSFERIASSVEATIFIRVVEGSWPDGARGQITALFSPALGERDESIKLLACVWS
ncbi:hypothetical protein PR202_gb10992 [Eleusine coracana subsp. coracana]|uniref:DUF6598 domain-containing protein n=1 Tax=Eleusine coracana subsp. coracana TaxID=191504 RepID=A0AAV5EM83_ELECO|nr:hypothetical protein PR202_gb10992 [Eleusine coracana subsp. coracana]